jgi:hypothetical protein
MMLASSADGEFLVVLIWIAVRYFPRIYHKHTFLQSYIPAACFVYYCTYQTTSQRPFGHFIPIGYTPLNYCTWTYLSPSKILKIITFCCVQDGVVREHGTHSELLAMKGHYFRLVQAQRLYENDVGWVEIQIYSCHWCCSPMQSKTSHNSGL